MRNKVTIVFANVFVVDDLRLVHNTTQEPCVASQSVVTRRPTFLEKHLHASFSSQYTCVTVRS